MAEPGEVCDDDDPMGLVEGCVATVLFQQGADQSPSRKKWRDLHFESRKSPGKRKRIFPTAKCEHAGCYQFSKLEDGRCLVAELKQNAANLNSTWMGHLAAYLSHDEGDRDGQGAVRKNQKGFRNFARQHFLEKIQEGGANSEFMLQVWYHTTGRKPKVPSRTKMVKLKNTQPLLGFIPVCYVLQGTNVLALRRLIKKDITFYNCIFDVDSNENFVMEFPKLEKKFHDKLIDLGCAGKVPMFPSFNTIEWNVHHIIVCTVLSCICMYFIVRSLDSRYVWFLPACGLRSEILIKKVRSNIASLPIRHNFI